MYILFLFYIWFIFDIFFIYLLICSLSVYLLPFFLSIKPINVRTLKSFKAFLFPKGIQPFIYFLSLRIYYLCTYWIYLLIFWIVYSFPHSKYIIFFVCKVYTFSKLFKHFFQKLSSRALSKLSKFLIRELCFSSYSNSYNLKE